MVQTPLGCRPLVIADMNEANGVLTQQRYLKLIKRHREAIADRFDIGFLSSPAAEEGCRRVVRGSQFLRLERTEESDSDLMKIGQFAQPFDIYAYRAVMGESVERHTLGMRFIEAEMFFIEKEGFTLGTAGETYFRGVGFQIIG